jgi:hypothetical protein
MGRDIPQPDPAVVAGRDERAAVGGELGPVDLIRPARGPEDSCRRAGGDVPEPHRAVLAAGDERAAVGGETRAIDGALVSAQRSSLAVAEPHEVVPGEFPHVRIAGGRTVLAQQFRRPGALAILRELVRLADVDRIPMVTILIALPHRLGTLAPDQDRGGTQARGREDQDQHGHGQGRPVPSRPFRRPFHRARPPGMNRPVLEESPEVVGQFRRGLVAAPRLPGHRLQDDGLQLAGDRLIEPPRRSRLLIGDPAQQFLPIAATEGRFQGQELVERRAQRVDVGAVVEVSPLRQRLLGAQSAAARRPGPPRSDRGTGRSADAP